MTLSDVTESGRDFGTTLGHEQLASFATSRNGSGLVVRDGDAGNCRSGHGLQCERGSGRKSVSRFLVLPQTTMRLVGGGVEPTSHTVSHRLCLVEAVIYSAAYGYDDASGHGLDSLSGYGS